MQEIVAELVRLRRVGQTMLLLQRAAVVLAWALGIVVVAILFDYLVRMPVAMRLLLLLGGLAALGATFWTYVTPAIRFRPDLTALALRVERGIPALRGRLASGVEFAETGLDTRNPLAARAVAEAQRRAATHPLSTVIDGKRTKRDVAVFAAIGAMALALALAYPAVARTGLARVLLPFSGAEWPARTGVVSLMAEDAPHPRGIPLPLRAKATLGEIDRLRVTGSYRLVQDGRPGPWRNIVLTHQSDGVYERLVDTDAEAIEFSFATEDAQTEMQRVRLVEPPAVRRATLVVAPPPYAPNVATVSHEMGPGTDRRASSVPPVPEGSSVRLELELNKPLPVPASDAGGREQWTRGTFGWSGEKLPTLAVDADDSAQWTLEWRMDRDIDLTFSLVDADGIGNVDDIGYRIQAAPDRDPSVSIIEPQTDDAVLPTAVVPVVVEARDDLGVDRLSLKVSREAPTRGAAPDELAAHERTGGGTTERLEVAVSMNELNAVPGQTILLQATAKDAFEFDGRRHAEVVSPVRRLRIITETDLIEQIRRQLAVMRQNAIRIDNEQGELQEAVAEHGPQPGAGRRQSQVGERLAQQTEALRSIAERQGRNGLDDPELNELLRSTEERLDRAGQSSNRAAEALEQRLAEESGEGRPSDAERDLGAGDEPRSAEERKKDEPALDAQQEVRDELADLIALLDRDEDSWVVTRRLERLQESLSQAQQETARLANQTVGRSTSELAEAELSELERIAARQRDAADEAAQVMEDMEQRAEGLDKVDPDRAGVMRQAARSGQQGALEQKLQQGAEETAGNRLQNAQVAQQAAQRTLDQMMRDIKESRRARARELQRQLASLVESIERLVHIQEDELIALARADEPVQLDDRARALIRLAQNTDGVADEARRAGREADRVTRVLGRAADAQGAAVQELRAEPPQVDRSRDAQERSLVLLKEALDEAKKLQERVDREEAERQREELVERYRQLAEQQVALLQEAEQAADAGGRRQLLDARRIGIGQAQVRGTLGDLEQQYPAVEQSKMFTLTHRRMREWSEGAEKALQEGDVGAATRRAQERIADSLSRIIQSLEQDPPDPEAFATDDAGGGGGGGGGGGKPPVIPPAAELKLLRGLQEQVYEQTKALDGSGLAGDDAEQRTRLESLASEQRELFQLALEMLTEMSEQRQPPGGEQEPPTGDPQ